MLIRILVKSDVKNKIKWCATLCKNFTLERVTLLENMFVMLLDIFSLVRSSIPHVAKTNAIALIPKIKHASLFSYFRPISLCNSFYKIIIKILVIRMMVVLPLIIKKSQPGFIKDKVLYDHILHAKKILFDFNSNLNFF